MKRAEFLHRVRKEPVPFLERHHLFEPTVPPAFRARLPPSMGIRVPVIQLEASEARNTARPRMSSGLPSRPAGMPRKKPDSRSGRLHPLGEARVEHLGRQDRVHAHAAAAPFGAQLAGHLGDGAHRHAVRKIAAAQGGRRRRSNRC